MDFPLTNYVASRRSKCQIAFEGRTTLTPPSLAKKMVGQVFDHLPDDPEVLAEKAFLDPACGTGIFGAVVFDYLFDGLEGYISDPDERARHIAREQIWMCDVSLAQVESARELFPDFFEPKIIERDTLNYDWDMEFDVVVGNPPYEAKKKEGMGTTGEKNLYRKFILKDVSLLKEKGFITFVCPPAFLKTTVWGEATKYFRPFKELNFISYESDVSKFFDSSTPISVFLLQNINEYTGTEVDGKFKVDVSNRTFLPRVINENTINIVDKVAKSFDDNFKFIRNDDGYGGDEKIVGMKRYNHVTKSGDMNVKVNNENVNLYYEIEEPKKLKALLDSKLFRYLNIVCRYDAVIYHYFMNGFTHPPLSNLSTPLSDQEVYEHYELSDEEINEIESFVQ